ncbi:MAG TPA: hypothetical protein VK864_04645, partial [Longimicrobiales bacterium]|nr:hypothetical protein [Longimicrobiales bacterium]
MVSRPARRAALTSVGAFLLGLVLAAGATAAWLMAVTGSEREMPAIAVDTLRQIRERTNGRGEIATAQRTIAERLAAVRVPTNPLRGEIGIRAANITWRDGTRRPFLRAERLRGVLNIDAAEHGDIVVDDVTITGANVLLDQPAPSGEWNYERVLADLLNDNDVRANEAERTVMFRNVHFENSRAEIRQPNRHLEFENINGLATRIQFSGPDVAVTELDIARLSALHEDVLKQAQLQVSAENARVRLPEGRVDFEAERATVGSARLANLEGRWEIGGPGLGLTMAGRANDVELSELAYFSERLPKEGRGSFGFDLRSLAGDALEIRLSDADVTAEGSRFRGAFALRTGGETLELISVDARLEPLALALVERLSGRD